MKKSHVDTAQEWFDKYGIKAVFFSRLLPVVRTFISLPAGFAKVNMKKFIIYTFIGSLPWTMFILYIGMILGENWKTMLAVGHEASFSCKCYSCSHLRFFTIFAGNAIKKKAVKQ